MRKTPQSLRLQIGFFGRTNVGKSSWVNLIADQEAAITSPVAGTTTDVVEKSMELLPLGPVTLLDTAGLDDLSELAEQRMRKTRKAFDRCDVVVLVVVADQWGEAEAEVVQEAERRGLPVLLVVNQTDRHPPAEAFLARLQAMGHPLVCGSATATDGRSAARARFREGLLGVVPADLLAPPALVGDLLPAGGLAVLVTPIDLQAPKGRLIQPQVQTIRDALDTDAAVMVVKEREFRAALARLKAPPDLVVCDSQVVAQVVAETPKDVPVTTFSILFSRLKGDLATLVRGAAAVDQLQAGDKVLIAEACSHHALEDDIARVKIPRWLRQYTGCALDIHHCAGHDTPDDLEAYRLVIHCGGCMINRREMLSRLSAAQAQGVAMTNYGVCIAKLQGVLPRVLAPFPHLAVEAAPHQPIA